MMLCLQTIIVFVVVCHMVAICRADSAGCKDTWDDNYCSNAFSRDPKICNDSYYRPKCRSTCGLCDECMDLRSDCSVADCRNNVWKVQCRKRCSACVQEVRGGGVGDETTTFTTSTTTTTWGVWGSWTCSVTCGRGTETRTRTCTPPGATCAGVASETRDCERPACCVPRHGQWSIWGSWSSCSRSCGGGTQTRSRTCEESNDCVRPCQGNYSEYQDCNVKECPRAPAVPSITTDPQTSPLSAGVTVTLTCSSLDLGSPPATLTWDTARQGTRTSLVDDDTTRLEIPNISVEDDGLSVKCQANNTVSPKEKSIVLRVDQNASFGECHVSASSATWEVMGYCDITKVFSSNNQYDCQWREIKGHNTNNISSSFNLSLITPGRKLQRGKCGFKTSIPRDFPELSEVSRELKYQMYFNPGGTWSPIINVSVVSPKAPTLTCPADVMEGSNINCTCSTSDVGEPQGRLLLFYNDQLQHTGQYGQKVIVLSRDAVREDNNARVSCRLHWARNTFADRDWTLRVTLFPAECSDNLTDCPRLATRCADSFVQEFCRKTCSRCHVHSDSSDAATSKRKDRSLDTTV
ncbi:uncharacterized protein LOC112568845 isoform X2 [Pomacea canaliculata]|uniref:uncharacterized protein LOC112568845 isoform X2 n=1 Tax=Pomacea canaliculata TaxID=400727 RepID=UPI000D73AB8F|nr:uncharacterized protein LOC112568845 isoform X2 [Pomacea canaliculata]